MTASAVTAYLALGSNIAPLVHIPRCLQLLTHLPDSTVTAVSTWYYSRPLAVMSTADFVNLVVALTTTLTPAALFNATQSIELTLGRVRDASGARTIDIDLLLHGATVQHTASLTLPHPGLLLRDFVLLPLLEIAPPDICDPRTGASLAPQAAQLFHRQIIAPVPASAFAQ